MMRHAGLALLGMTLLLTAPVARAADAPVLSPTRGVAVTYKLSRPGQDPAKLLLTYDGTNRVRMDSFRTLDAASPFSSLLFDPPANRVLTLVPEQHGYWQRDVGNLPSPGTFLNSHMTFTQLGTATVAGTPCTDWRVSNGPTFEGTACVTDDGVMLRAVRTKPSAQTMEALAVHYAPVPGDVFNPPADYHPLQPADTEPAKPSAPPPAAAAAPPSNAQTATATPGPAAPGGTAAAPPPQAPSPPAGAVAAPPTPPLQAYPAPGQPAQDLPPLPTRDVAVTYRVTGMGSNDAEKLMVTYAQAGARSRIDFYRWAESKVPYLAIIFDGPDNRLIELQFDQRSALERSIGDTPNSAAFIISGTRLTHPTPAKVADTACTDWTMQSADGKTDHGTACLTSDSVLLRLVRKMAAGATGSLTATAVTYATPPVGTFAPPSGFARLAAH